MNLDYSVDEVGNIVGVNQSGTQFNLSYDKLYRLTDVKAANNALIEGFTYDATGNRLSKQLGTTPPVNYSYAATDHKLTNAGDGVRNFDANGNTLNTPQVGVLAYDERNRLLSIGQYYNARGERAQIRLGSRSIPYQLFLYSESGALLAESSVTQYGKNIAPIDYIYMDSMPVARVDSTGSYPIEADHLGSPRNIQATNGKSSIWRWNLLANTATGSNAFGEQTATGTVTDFNLRFPGQYVDGNGLSYNYFRDYESGTGRYVESDPIGLNGGIATFGYAASSPGKFIDPSGLSIRCICGQTKGGGVERGLLWGWNKTTLCSYRCRCFCNSDMPDNIPFDFSEKLSGATENTECRVPFPRGETAISFDLIEEANSLLPWPVLGGFPDKARDWLPQMEKFCKCKSQACCT